MVRIHPVISYKAQNLKAYAKLCASITFDEGDDDINDHDSDLEDALLNFD